MVNFNLVLATASLAVAAPTIDLLTKRAACDPQAPGVSGYSYSPDTAQAFLANPDFSSAATSAPTPSAPSPYTLAFSNLPASNNAQDYRGYYFLDSYDPDACAAHCNAQFDCRSFNINFERDPSVEPGSGCDNPPSVTYIKCVLWAGPVTPDNAVNTGYTADHFQVVITGNNGYYSGIADPTGYSGRQYFGTAAISSNDNYVGSNTYQGTFDASKCAADCTAHTSWAAGQSGERACTFFNTYYQYVNDGSNIEGQVCVLYAATLDGSSATNVGQYRANGDHVLIADSYGWSVNSS